MVGKISMGAGFGGTMRYVLDGDGRNHKQVRVLDYEGVDVRMNANGQPSPDAAEVARSFRLQAMLNQEVTKPVIHVTLSWPPEDAPRLSDEEMVSAAKQYMEEMGWTNTQYIIARHLEKDNPHIHIVLNKVDNEGKRLNDSYCKSRNVKVCRQITDDRQYTIGRSKMVSTARDISDPREECRYRIAREVVKAVAKVDDIHQLPELLAKQGICCKIKDDNKGIPRGISFGTTGKDGREYHFSGSQVDRKFTASNLSKAIVLKDRMPEILKEARWLDELYHRASPHYDIPRKVREQCSQLTAELRILDREEARLEQDKSRIRSTAARSAFFAILSGNVVEALMLTVIASLALAIRDRKIKTTQEAKNSLEAMEIRMDTQLKYHQKKPMQPPSPQESPEQRMPQGEIRAYRHIAPAEDNDTQEQQPRIRGPRL